LSWAHSPTFHTRNDAAAAAAANDNNNNNYDDDDGGVMAMLVKSKCHKMTGIR
jgi:hypothetical protein